jgi:hypothetical protein
LVGSLDQKITGIAFLAPADEGHRMLMSLIDWARGDRDGAHGRRYLGKADAASEQHGSRSLQSRLKQSDQNDHLQPNLRHHRVIPERVTNDPYYEILRRPLKDEIARLQN